MPKLQDYALKITFNVAWMQIKTTLEMVFKRTAENPLPVESSEEKWCLHFERSFPRKLGRKREFFCVCVEKKPDTFQQEKRGKRKSERNEWNFNSCRHPRKLRRGISFQIEKCFGKNPSSSAEWSPSKGKIRGRKRRTKKRKCVRSFGISTEKHAMWNIWICKIELSSAYAF